MPINCPHCNSRLQAIHYRTGSGPNTGSMLACPTCDAIEVWPRSLWEGVKL